jgi:hypothetical protein
MTEHPSRRQLLLHLDGELARPDEARVRAHLAACGECRALVAEFESIGDLVRERWRESDGQAPSAAGPRALLRARLAELSSNRPGPLAVARGFVWAAMACALLLFGMYLSRPNPERRITTIVYLPNPRLTPGATTAASGPAVCSQANIYNKDVPAALQREVFQEYGLDDADPRAYEVDYLVTPALGGADDIHNLWPHSYSATVWNARVKDALENRLRVLVCDGSVDLGEAQREIAQNWIGAYKKYFHTDEPLAEHTQPVTGKGAEGRPE